MGRAVRFVSGYLPSGVGTVSLNASDRTDQPTAAIIKAVKSTAGVENGAAYSLCVTDFATTAMLTGFDLHNAGTSQSGREHVTSTLGEGVRLLDAVDGSPPFSEVKIASFARQDGGLEFSASLGSAYALQVMLFFEWGAAVVNTDGDGAWSTDEAIALSHTLGVPAGMGFMFANGLFDAANTHMNLSMGMFIDDGSFDDDDEGWVSSITQYCAAYRWQNGLTTSNTAGRIYSNRVTALGNNSGGAFSAQEVTANDVNLLQITNRDGGTTGSGVIGLLLDTQGIDVELDVIDLPASGASDWEYDGSAFEPGAIFGIMTQYTALDTGAGSALAGAYTMVGWDDLGGSMSAGMASEDNVTTTNTASHESDDSIQHYSDDSTLTHEILDLTFTADGWDVAAADLTATGTAKFICAILSGSAPELVNAIDQVGEIAGLAVLYDNEINVRISGAGFGASGVVELSDYDIQGGESPGTDETQAQVSYSDTEIRFDVDLGSLSPGDLYLTVTPTAGDPSTVQVTVNADPGTSTVARRAASVNLNATQGVPIAAQDLGPYFHKTDAQDTVTYSVDVLPAGLSHAAGVISGTIAASAATFSPYTVTMTCTDSFGNFITDSFTWTIGAPAGEIIERVRVAQFNDIGPDLWDVDDDTG